MLPTCVAYPGGGGTGPLTLDGVHLDLNLLTGAEGLTDLDGAHTVPTPHHLRRCVRPQRLVGYTERTLKNNVKNRGLLSSNLMDATFQCIPYGDTASV